MKKLLVVLVIGALMPLALPQQALAAGKCVRSSIASTPGRDFYKCPDGTSMKVTPLTEYKSKAVTSDGRKLICSKSSITGNLKCR